MGRTALLVRRELGSYFTSAMAYVVLTSFLALSGFGFLGMLDAFQNTRLPVRFEDHLAFLLSLLTMITPLLTMGLVAEEKNRGTLETLLTAPVSEFQVVMAKFLGAFAFVHVLFALPLVGYALLIRLHTRLDTGALLTSWLGVALMSAMLVSLGLFISSLCRSQVSAGVVTFVVSLLLMLLGFAAANVPEGSLFRELLQKLAPDRRVYGFLRGILDTRDVLFFATLSSFFLFLTHLNLSSRRWR